MVRMLLRGEWKSTELVALPSLGKASAKGQVLFPGAPHITSCQIPIKILSLGLGSEDGDAVERGKFRSHNETSFGPLAAEIGKVFGFDSQVRQLKKRAG